MRRFCHGTHAAAATAALSPPCRNHTAANQSAKAHKNGIKKPQRQRYASRKG